VTQTHLDSARLLTRVAPLVLVDDTFALKGGTAINLFVRDMPRLSVDLDLIFPDYILPRDEALKRINEAIRQPVARLRKQGFQTHAPASADAGETKLPVRQGTIEVKVEVNFVMRGTVHPVCKASLTQNAHDTLQRISKFLQYRLKTSTAASWSLRWIANIRAICSTSCSSSRTRVSRRASAAYSSSISRAITGRCKRSCFRRFMTCVRSLSIILQA
jgi:Nucleotidyl transferase AbiEii toxin, Type IV TA system